MLPSTYERVAYVGVPQDYSISPVDRLLWNTYAVYREGRYIQTKLEEIRQIDLGELEVAPADGALNVVVVIGESLRRDYMHCYGYPLPNTPHLDSLLQTGSLIRYTQVTSPSTGTIESLTKVLTYQTIGDEGAWYQYPCLTNVLARSGYATYWVSNQEVVGAPMQPLNTIASFTDELTHIQTRIQDADQSIASTSRVGHDMEVLDHLHGLESVGDKRIVQFIHLIGCHFDYDKRYPAPYARFRATDIAKLGTKGDREVLASYVNSVYYNDHVLGEIIRAYSQTPTLLFYFSDHGEALYDAPGKPDFFGHALPVRSNVEIPFLVYVSPALQQRSPELFERLRGYADRPIVNDVFTHSLLGLLGIRTKYADPRLECFGEGYDLARPRQATNLGQPFTP